MRIERARMSGSLFLVQRGRRPRRFSRSRGVRVKDEVLRGERSAAVNADHGQVFCCHSREHFAPHRTVGAQALPGEGSVLYAATLTGFEKDDFHDVSHPVYFAAGALPLPASPTFQTTTGYTTLERQVVSTLDVAQLPQVACLGFA